MILTLLYPGTLVRSIIVVARGETCHAAQGGGTGTTATTTRLPVLLSFFSFTRCSRSVIYTNIHIHTFTINPFLPTNKCIRSHRHFIPSHHQSTPPHPTCNPFTPFTPTFHPLTPTIHAFYCSAGYRIEHIDVSKYQNPMPNFRYIV